MEQYGLEDTVLVVHVQMYMYLLRFTNVAGNYELAIVSGKLEDRIQMM